MKQGDVVKFLDDQKIGTYQESPSPWVKFSDTEFRFITDTDQVEKL